jgi:hypothetical protein
MKRISDTRIGNKTLIQNLELSDIWIESFEGGGAACACGVCPNTKEKLNSFSLPFFVSLLDQPYLTAIFVAAGGLRWLSCLLEGEPDTLLCLYMIK